MNTPNPRAAFRPSGVITLTTDFGHTDPFVGVMKGQVLRRFAAARLVDLTHAVTVHRPVEAGFWLGRAYPYFAPGTVHVAVVDPGVGSSRRIVAVEGDGHLFLAPDNGLLAGVLQRLSSVPLVRCLDSHLLESLGLDQPSHTFHGRDIFAPVAAELAAGRLAPDRLGTPGATLVPGELAEARRKDGVVIGAVVTIDHFGNLLTNVDAGLLDGIVQPVVRAGGRELPLLRTYSDARPGEYLALVNSFGVLEIARAGGSAAAGLGLERGAVVEAQEAQEGREAQER
jgi:S-adenosylmethionine hydrolase